jgi:phage shock protein C
MSAPVRPPSNTGRYIWGSLLIVLGLVWLADRHDLYFLVPWRWHYYWPNWLSFGVIFSVLLIGLGLYLVVRGVPENRFASPSSFSPSTNFAPTGENFMNAKRMMRSRSDRMIGGVCGGMAEYFNIDPSLVRVGWVLITFFSGFFLGIIAYVVLMVVVPEQSSEPNNSARVTQ